MPMKLKTVAVDGKTYAEIVDGKPVYIHDDGKELPFDAQHTIDTIARLNGEAKGHREAKETAEAALKVFEGIDATAAKDALAKIANLSGKKLIEAGEVDAAIAAALKPVQDKLTAAEKTAQDATDTLNRELIGGAFARSKFIGDKVAIPSDLMQSRFGSHFEVKDGKTVAKDAAGNPIYSRSKPGELAEFDEAMEIIVEAYPQKAHILKGSGANGGGAPNNGGAPAGAKTITRKDFDALDAGSRTAKIREGFTVSD